MTVYHIKLIKSPDITDAERKRRLARAYDLILSWNGRDTAGLGAIGGQDQVGDNTPDPEGQEHDRLCPASRHTETQAQERPTQ